MFEEVGVGRPRRSSGAIWNQKLSYVERES